MTPYFSVIHATRGRPEKAVAAMRMWRDRAAHPGSVEYLICTDADDDTRFNLDLGSHNTARFGAFLWIEHPGRGSASAWDFAAKFSRGEILIQAQDDVEPPPHWDAMLIEWLEGANAHKNWWRGVPVVVTVRDGYRKDALLCTAIMNRARYWQQGEFLHAGYISVFSDDEFSYRCYRDERNDKCHVIRSDLVFLHRHAYHDASIKFDATYARENSQEAYSLGADLFLRRNPEACRDGLKTW